MGSHQEVQIQEEEAIEAQKRQQKEKGRGKLRLSCSFFLAVLNVFFRRLFKMEKSTTSQQNPPIVDSRGHGTSEAQSLYNLPTVPFGLLKLRMSKQLVSDYRKYLKALEKQANCQQRFSFMTSCLENDLIPKFLNFRVPSNGCFEPTTVHNFQRRLLRKEIAWAKEHQKELTEPLEVTRAKLRGLSAGIKLSLIKHLRLHIANLRLENKERHQKKL